MRVLFCVFAFLLGVAFGEMSEIFEVKSLNLSAISNSKNINLGDIFDIKNQNLSKILETKNSNSNKILMTKNQNLSNVFSTKILNSSDIFNAKNLHANSSNDTGYFLNSFKAPKNELLDKISPFENAPKAYEKDTPQIDVGGEIRLRYEKQIGSKSLKRPEKDIEGSLHIGIKPWNLWWI